MNYWENSMEMIFFVAMFALLAYVMYRNFTLISRYRHNKEYIECYKEMLQGTDTAYERINAYIENEKAEEFKNKGRILKLYEQMDMNEDLSGTLNDLDLRAIFLKNGKKIAGLPELENRVEYQLTKAIYNALCEKEDAGVGFLSSLLDGTYAGYEYEKNLIGLFKRFASSTLAYSGEPMEDYYKEDLHSFAATQIGKTYMKDLEIYDKYPPREKEEEKPQEETQPENKE